MSLLETVKRMDPGVLKPLVLLPCRGPLCDLLKKEAVVYRITPLFVFYYCSQTRVQFNSVRTIFCLFWDALRNIFFLPGILLKEKAHVVVINSSTLLLSGLIAGLMGQRVIWHTREVISTEKSSALKNIIASTMNFSAEKVIAPSCYSERDMRKLGVKNTVMIYNGVDLRRFRKKDIDKKLAGELGISPGSKIVGFVGQIYKLKGWRTFLSSAFILSRKMPDVKFIVVGSGNLMSGSCRKGGACRLIDREEELFCQTADSMKLSDRFVFLGHRSDVEDIIPMMDCIVFPSIVPEVFGRVMIEAMACGIPVVASNIGAVPEIVRDNVTGLLFDPDDMKSLADRLETVLTDSAAAIKMGEAGRKSVEELFDINEIVGKLLNVYVS